MSWRRSKLSWKLHLLSSTWRQLWLLPYQGCCLLCGFCALLSWWIHLWRYKGCLSDWWQVKAFVEKDPCISNCGMLLIYMSNYYLFYSIQSLSMLSLHLGSISKFSSATLFPMSISACSDSDIFTHGTQMFPFESRSLRKSIRYNRQLVFDVNIGMFRFRYLLHATQEFPFEINLNSDNRII